MLKYEVSRGVGVDTNSWARVCDTCHSAPCTVYCRADSAYLCTACDARVHAANQVASRHERVWVCEACERAPAAFLCKADAASLCAACDADIHSANPLARRHIRVPIMPVSGSLYGLGPRMGSESSDGFLAQPEGEEEGDGDEDEDESASWLLLGKNNSSSINQEEEEEENIGNEFIIQGEVDQYLDLCDYNSGAENNYCHEQSELSVPEKNGDSVVPVQCGEVKEHHHYQNFLFGMECEAKSVMQCETKSGHIYTANSFGHNVSVSSLDVGVVPEYSTSDLSLSHPRPAKGTIDLFSNPPVQMPTQLSPLDREARVMRYREKKKTRKFEKTIRYASRKAYAETRPRIKGRFAKRSDVEAEMDQIFPTSHIPESGYGIVPSF